MGQNKVSKKRSPAAEEFLFDIDPEPVEEQLI
jgi:hypothetical protein